MSLPACGAAFGERDVLATDLWALNCSSTLRAAGFIAMQIRPLVYLSSDAQASVQPPNCLLAKSARDGPVLRHELPAWKQQPRLGRCFRKFRAGMVMIPAPLLTIPTMRPGEDGDARVNAPPGGGVQACRLAVKQLVERAGSGLVSWGLGEPLLTLTRPARLHCLAEVLGVPDKRAQPIQQRLVHSQVKSPWLFRSRNETVRGIRVEDRRNCQQVLARSAAR